jgi:signal transduction histidine kinase
MERDLHDGAQQRILAIALQLQSARVNDTPDVLRAGIDQAVAGLGTTVHELRDLASGLQPPALAGGGLRAATEDLANRIPVRMRLDIVDQRFPPRLESAAWFVVAEGVSNAVKHAGVGEVEIGVYVESDALHVVVADQGVGGANASGSGLQGLADRVSALGGRLLVEPGTPRGTRLEAVFPCG